MPTTDDKIIKDIEETIENFKTKYASSPRLIKILEEDLLDIGLSPADEIVGNTSTP